MSRSPNPPRFWIPLHRLKIIVETALLMTEYLGEGKDFDAYGLLWTSEFNDDEILFIWDLFDSTQRRRMKEAKL